MTYKEKLEKEHPEMIVEHELGGCEGCPADYDYEDGVHCHTVGDDCEACWNREIPESDYKVGDKFVIEIKEIDDLKNHMILENIAVGTDMLDKMERLDSDYVNEYFGELQDEAYNKGLNDVWELVKKLCTMSAGDKIDIFGLNYSALTLVGNYTPQEVLAKLEAYENEIKVGDVVENPNFGEAVVLDTDYYGKVAMLTNSGKMTHGWDKSALTKTGKHIDIQSVLEQIGGAGNE